MATTEQTSTENSQQYVDFDEYVGYHLSRTQAGIKSNEILTTLGWIATLGLGYLLVFTVLDHWVIDGGFSRGARIGLLLGALSAGLGWFAWRVIMPYLRRINVLYAAREIEKTAPSLKGGLLNLVDLQHANKKIPPHIRTAIEKHAALELSHVDVEQAVDRRPLMRVSYLLLGVVTACCLYALFSPKDILASVKRALLPTSQTAPPTQTRITDVEPGDVTVVARSSVRVTANIGGREPEAVTLYYSTADRKYVDEPIAMQRESDDLPRYVADLTGENARGLLSDVMYHIEAGDAHTHKFQITVVKPPSADVNSVSYEFPSYMEMENRTEPTGHISAHEGTGVSITAETNIPVKTAKVVFVENDQPTGEEVAMRVTDGTKLSGKWILEIREDGTFAPHYWIECETEDGRTDPDPTRYNVLIKPDLPPDVELLAPQRDLRIPANGTVPLVFRAADPDFRLRSLRLMAVKDGSEIVAEPLMDEDKFPRGVEGTYDWKLEPLNLTPGEKLQFYLQAKDNRQPLANTTQTAKLNIEIIEPVSEEEAQKQLEEEKERQREETDQAEPQDAGQEEREQQERQEQDGGDTEEQQNQETDEEGDATNESQETGEEGDSASTETNEEGASQPGKNGESQDQQRPLDPENEEDQEEALRQILEHEREKQQNEEEPQDQTGDESNPNQTGDQQNDQRKPGEQPKPGEQKDSQDQQNKDQQQPGEKPEPGERGERPDGADDTNPEQPGENKPGDQPQGDEPSGTEQQQNGPKPEEAADPKPSEDPPVKDQKPEGENPGGKPDDSKPQDQGDPQSNGEKPTTGGDEKKKPQGGNESADKPDADPQAKDPGQQDESVKGTEQPAEDDPNAKKKEATGEETGPAKASDEKEAEKAKKDLKREGGKDEQGRKPGDPQDKPQAQEKGDPQDPDAAQAEPKPSDKEAPTEKTSQSDEKQPSDTPPESGDPSEKKSGEKTEPKAEETSDKPPESDQPPEGGENNEEKSTEKKPGDSSKEPGSDGQSQEGDQPGDPNQPGGKPKDKPGKPSESNESGPETGESPEGEPQPSDGGKPGKSNSKTPPPNKNGDSQAPPPSSENTGSTEEKPAGSPKGQGTGSGATAPSEQSEEQPVGGNAQGNGPNGDQAQQPNADGTGESTAPPVTEEDNSDTANKAVELTLDKINGTERGEVDQELLEKLGWTEDQLRDFTERMQDKLQRVQDKTDDSPEAIAERRQFEEMLKDLRPNTQAKKRESSNKNLQRVDQLDVEGRKKVPLYYRSRLRSYTRNLSKSANESGDKGKKK